MNHKIVFMTPTFYDTVDYPDCSAIHFAECIEQFRKDGWVKVLQEYVPAAKTCIAIMAKEE